VWVHSFDYLFSRAFLLFFLRRFVFFLSFAVSGTTFDRSLIYEALQRASPLFFVVFFPQFFFSRRLELRSPLAQSYRHSDGLVPYVFPLVPPPHQEHGYLLPPPLGSFPFALFLLLFSISLPFFVFFFFFHPADFPIVRTLIGSFSCEWFCEPLVAGFFSLHCDFGRLTCGGDESCGTDGLLVEYFPGPLYKSTSCAI